jgi:hypothetical protein
MNETAMISSEKKIAGVTSRAASPRSFGAPCSRGRGRVLELLVAGLDHDDLGVDGGADGDGDAAEAHDRRRDAEEVHRDEGEQHGEREAQDRQQGAAQVQQEQQDDEGDDDALLDQGVLRVSIARSIRALAVVGRHDLDALRQAGAGRRAGP